MPPSSTLEGALRDAFYSAAGFLVERVATPGVKLATVALPILVWLVGLVSWALFGGGSVVLVALKVVLNGLFNCLRPSLHLVVASLHACICVLTRRSPSVPIMERASSAAALLVVQILVGINAYAVLKVLAPKRHASRELEALLVVVALSAAAPHLLRAAV
jgi:hypothetical protein